MSDVEASWGPARKAAMKHLLDAGHPPMEIPEHWHWDWGRKRADLRLLAYRCFGIECEGEMQGMAMTVSVGYNARLAPEVGKPLLYLKYLETAPWNARVFTAEPRFGAIGFRLVETAVKISEEEGFHGRVGLHSLPQAESFYEGTCGMTRSDPDPAVKGLPYFELTREQAKAFL